MTRDNYEARSAGVHTHDDPVADQALAWFAQLRNATPDADVRAEFEAWLARNQRHAEEYRALEAIWGSASFHAAAQSLPARTRRRAIPRPGLRGLAAAAVIFLAIGTWQYPSLMLRWRADYLTETGGRTTVSLPDGSRMTLNTASAVSIDFEGGRRQVTVLQGEAYFDVLSDLDRPFRVDGRFGKVEVFGTAFSVRADADEDRIVLERGRVNVSRLSDRRDAVDLDPGQMVLARADSLSPVKPADTEAALAWRDGRIIFENQPLSRVLDELERYYSGRVIIADRRAGRVVVTGNYRLDDVESAIRTLADAARVTMHRLPGGIIILR